MKDWLVKSKTGYSIGIAVVYFLLSLPFLTLDFSNGYSELRLSGLLPVAAGLLFGFPGALACALGNLAGDLYTGLDVYCFFGFFGNFLMAWIPYKLWHTLFFSREHEPRYLNTMHSMMKFVVISFISSCISAGTIAAGGQLLQGFSFSSFLLPVGLQYYDLSLLGGMLIFQVCMTVFHIKPCIPKEVYQQQYDKKRYVPDYILVSAIVILTVILTFRTTDSGVNFRMDTAIMCVLVLVFSAVLALLPMTRGGKASEKIENREVFQDKGMRAQFVTVFLLILCIFLIIAAAGSYRILLIDYRWFSEAEGNIPLLWMRIIMGIACVGTILIIILGLFLKTIQRKVVEPVFQVTEYTRQFVAGEKLTDERLQLVMTGNELDELGNSVNVMADSIRDFVEDIRLRTMKEERMTAELNVARDIQQGMLPTGWMGRGFDLVPYIKPAKEVGGDFYHFFELDENRVFVCIADVSGKDISAAMFMVQAKILIEAACHLPLNQMLSRVNNTLSRANKAMLFVTAFTAVIDKKERRMTYANAGHNEPIYFNNGTARWLNDAQPDFVLGVMEGTQYKLNHIDIMEDFKLFIYTDGVNEAENKGGEFVGNDRMFQWVDKLMKEEVSCEQLIKQMEAHLVSFTKDANQSDDITMLAVAVK